MSLGLFHRTHLEAIGEVKDRHPWVEDTWRIGPGTKTWISIVRWQNIVTPSMMSMLSPRWVWGIYLHRELKIEVHWKHAPYRYDK